MKRRKLGRGREPCRTIKHEYKLRHKRTAKREDSEWTFHAPRAAPAKAKLLTTPRTKVNYLALEARRGEGAAVEYRAPVDVISYSGCKRRSASKARFKHYPRDEGGPSKVKLTDRAIGVEFTRVRGNEGAAADPAAAQRADEEGFPFVLVVEIADADGRDSLAQSADGRCLLVRDRTDFLQQVKQRRIKPLVPAPFEVRNIRRRDPDGSVVPVPAAALADRWTVHTGPLLDIMRMGRP